jgi:hypothetical protein
MEHRHEREHEGSPTPRAVPQLEHEEGVGQELEQIAPVFRALGKQVHHLPGREEWRELSEKLADSLAKDAKCLHVSPVFQAWRDRFTATDSLLLRAAILAGVAGALALAGILLWLLSEAFAASPGNSVAFAGLLLFPVPHPRSPKRKSAAEG